MGWLDSNGLSRAWANIKAALAKKQDKLTGGLGQVVGFDAAGNAVAQDLPSGSCYGVCGTASATAAKTVACSGFVLETGALITVKFTYYNTAESPTLNVNGTGAKSIKKYGTMGSMAYMWYSGEMVQFTYDGTNWVMTKGMTATTTYYGLTKLSNSITDANTLTAATSYAVMQVNLAAAEALALAKEHTHSAQDVFVSVETAAALGNLALQNLIKNGSFEYIGADNSADYWMTDDITQAYIAPIWSHVRGFDGERLMQFCFGRGEIWQQMDAVVDPTHTYYFRMLALTDGASEASVTVSLDSSGAILSQTSSLSSDVAIPISTTFSGRSAGSVRIYMAEISGNSVAVDAVLLVDLTAAFGAGNEPAKEECDQRIVYADTGCAYRISVDESLRKIAQALNLGG